MSDEWLSITDQQLHDRTIAAGENESGRYPRLSLWILRHHLRDDGGFVCLRLARRYPPDRHPH